MQHAGRTLKKIFAETLRRQAGGDAPLQAWPLACGSKVSEKAIAIGYAGGVLTVEVPDAIWKQQLQGLSQQYLAAMKQTSAEPVSAIEFVERKRSEQACRWKAD